MIQKIIFFLFLIGSFLTIAQKIDYTFEKTTVFQTVEVSKNIGWTKSSWTLGAFVKRGTTYHCVGAVDIVHPLTKSVIFSIYGEENGKIGYQEGELLRFFMKRHDTICSNFVSNIVYDKSQSAYFKAGSKILIQQIDSVFFGELYFSTGTNFCSFDKQITPQLIDIDPDLISFSTYANLIKIDSKTGQVFPQQSVENQYDTIYLNTDYCMQTPYQYSAIVRKTPYQQMNLTYTFCDTLPFKLNEQDFSRTLIGEKFQTIYQDTTVHYQVVTTNSCATIDTIQLKVHTLTTENVAVILKEETCEKGEIKVETSKEIMYYSLNGQKQQTPIFENLSTGNYQLSIENKWNCKASFPSIYLPFQAKNCDNTETLFLIFSNEEFNSLYFLETEEINIYNKQGKLVKNLQGPIQWDGVDLSGKIISTGLYIVQYQSGKQHYLKVIY